MHISLARVGDLVLATIVGFPEWGYALGILVDVTPGQERVDFGNKLPFRSMGEGVFVNPTYVPIPKNATPEQIEAIRSLLTNS